MRSLHRIVLAAVAVVLAMTSAMTAESAARPAYIADRMAGDGDPRSMLWEPKQAAFERLQAAMALPPTAERDSQDDYDVHYYDIDIEIDEGPETVDGSVVMRATSLVSGLTTVILNLYDNMTVDSVAHDGSPASYSHNNDLITVTLNSTVGVGGTFEIEVVYHGAPIDDALDFSTHGGGNPIISSLSEPSGARQWWPCKDTPADKADSARIALTVDDNLVAVSEGLLLSVVDNGPTKTYEWFESYPVTTYLVSVAISNYAHWTDYYNHSGGSMPIENYVYPEDLSDAQEDLNITAEAIGALANLFGEYPFLDEKYGHAIFPWGGAMEHQTCTSYGRVLIRGDHYYDWILVHELAHQWWGDWVTCETWDDIWLNEGFASYSEALWYEYLDGETGYDDYIESFDSHGYFDGPIYDPWSTFNRTVYDKGALVLHMLRRILELDGGPQSHYSIDGLLAVLADYGAANSYGTAVTSEFQATCETHYGSSLDWFFLPWVYGENRPSYEYAWVADDVGPTYQVMLHVEQVQTNAGLFTMPIDIVVHTTGGDVMFTVWNDDWNQDFFLDVDDPVTGLSFDPGNWILKYAAEVSTGTSSGSPSLELAVDSNPTGSEVALSYSVPSDGHVRLAIHDVAGRRVATIVDAEVPAGTHAVTWGGLSASGESVATGIYFARLQTTGGAISRKIVFMK